MHVRNIPKEETERVIGLMEKAVGLDILAYESEAVAFIQNPAVFENGYGLLTTVKVRLVFEDFNMKSDIIIVKSSMDSDFDAFQAELVKRNDELNP